jgi:GTPase SAR1 family protein
LSVLNHNFYRGSDGIIFVYDVTNGDSFLNIEKWMDIFDGISSQKLPKVKIILANKSDSYNRMVDTPMGMKFAAQKRVDLVEVSAKNGTNLDHGFNKLIQLLMNNNEKKENDGADEVENEIIQMIIKGESSEMGQKQQCCRMF